MRDLAPAQWLRDSMRTPGAGIGTLLPGHFAAYARIEHPPSEVDTIEGTLAPALLSPLIEHLRNATSTPGHCYFAVWEGFGEPMMIRAYPIGQKPPSPPPRPRRRRFHEPRL
ncbi:MAG TPA: hypothetical protein VFO55_01685, partial [Gemmatimonadaceae bacterium]|nr:hypothetical protein [Gemmatimonadaceae bacterium]